MSPLVLAYCLLLLAGVMWIAYRVLLYMRAERERESRWTDLLEDEDFKSYLKKLSTENKPGPDKRQQENPVPLRPLAAQPDRKPRQPKPGPKPGNRQPPPHDP